MPNLADYYKLTQNLRPILLAALLCILALFISPVLADHPKSEEKLQVLYLGSWHRDAPWPKAVAKGLKKRIQELHGTDFDLYQEDMDAIRFKEGSLYRALDHYIRSKYRYKQIDIVVVDGQPAARFLANRSELFTAAKRVYVNPGPTSDTWVNAVLKDKTVVPILTDFDRAIAEMIQVASPSSVYVVAESTSASGKSRLAAIKQALAKRAEPFKVEYLVNLPMNALLQQLAQLPKNSAVFYSLVLSDGEGHNFTPYSIARKIANQANAPVFSHWEVLIGSGIVGGYLLSGERVGSVAAETIFDVLASKPVDIDPSRVFEYKYDWRQLKRWDIDMSAIRPYAKMEFIQYSFFQQYKWPIIAVLISLILAIVFLIISIFINHKRRLAIGALDTERMNLEKRVLERTDALNQEKLKAEQLARIDVLTQLYNRRAFYEKAIEVDSLSRRYKHTYTLIMLDIDHFKKVNDNFGHDVGDKVISQVADALRTSIRTTDIPSRWGGEEFALILPETNIEAGMIIGQRILNYIEKQIITVEQHQVQVTASLGIAEFRDHEDMFDDVLQCADKALYQAKEEGRNRMVNYHQ